MRRSFCLVSFVALLVFNATAYAAHEKLDVSRILYTPDGIHASAPSVRTPSTAIAKTNRAPAPNANVICYWEREAFVTRRERQICGQSRLTPSFRAQNRIELAWTRRRKAGQAESTPRNRRPTYQRGPSNGLGSVPGTPPEDLSSILRGRRHSVPCGPHPVRHVHSQRSSCP